MNIVKDVLGFDFPIFGGKKRTINEPDLSPKDIAQKVKTTVSPARSTDPGIDSGGLYNFDQDKRLVQPGYQYEIIPLIRKLSLGNQSVSQALANIVNLANTGHTVTFDSGVDPIQVDKMRQHLEDVVPNWLYGISGMDGLANKLISQGMIAGAMCAEIVVANKLDKVYRFLMPNPESIRFIYNRPTITYEPYQKLNRLLDPIGDAAEEFGLKKLNPNSFKYFAINGDTESPYGNPPYLPAIGPLEDQKAMLENIKFIIRQVGIMGFWEVLVNKPDQANLETDVMYKARLERYLDEVKANMKNSYKDGMMVGFEEDHTFKFNTASASAGGVSDLFYQNELLVYSGLKQDAALSGKSDSGAESGMTIVFTKLLSELKNIQGTAGAILKYAYDLELRLVGFDYKSIKVKFGQSTVQDDLKVQQGREIKIRNARQERADGIINAEQHADQLGYERPHSTKPDPLFTPSKSTGDPNLDAQKKTVREKSKDASDRKVRDKNKPQGTKKK